MRRAQRQRGGDLGARHGPGDLLRPQRQGLPFGRVEEAGGLGDQAQFTVDVDAVLGEGGDVGVGVGWFGQVRAEVERPGGAGALAGQAAGAFLDLADRDGHQPGLEPGGVAQSAQVPDRAQHRLLHDVVDVGVGAQGAADHRVHQGQVVAEQGLQGMPVACAGGGHARGIRRRGQGDSYADRDRVQAGRHVPDMVTPMNVRCKAKPMNEPRGGHDPTSRPPAGPRPGQGTGCGGASPTYRESGRMIFESSACSSTLAHQPMTRLTANVGVNISRGSPQSSITTPA